jgi:16S rRNA (guanine527-N7)-methyltransferase
MSALASDTVGGLSVSRETFAALQAFEVEVRRWTPTVNLVSRGSLDHLWGRHIDDSAQIFRACPPDAERWLDIGSGGGFPGLVVAVLARELKPGLKVTLVESDQRKAAFLRQTAQKLGLSVEVLAKRVESLPPQMADVVSARALAPLSDLLGLAFPHLTADGTALFPKGARHAEEISEARRFWSFDLESRPSASDPDAALLIIRKIYRAQPH